MFGIGVLRFSGAEAAPFLQGQLTCDVDALADGGWSYAAYCSPKGRMLANGMLARFGEEFYFLLSADLCDSTLKRLRMYILRAKVEAARADDAKFVFNNSGGGDGGAGNFILQQFPNAVLLLNAKDSDSVDSPDSVVTDNEQAARLQIENGVGWVGAATADMFVPQMANWDLIGGVSFSKGCYVGQEVVARMHYLGRAKKRAALARGRGAPPAAGQEVYSASFGEGKQTAGNVVMAAQDGEEFVALVVAQLSAIDSGDLQLDGAPLAVQKPDVLLEAEKNNSG